MENSCKSSWHFAKVPIVIYFLVLFSKNVLAASMVFSYSDYLAVFCNLSLFLPEIRLRLRCTVKDSSGAVIRR